MNLCLYSGGEEIDNIALDKKVLSLLKTKDPSITYIPSCSYGSEFYFKDFVQHYKKMGVKRFIHFAVDVSQPEFLINEAFKSDIIHLSGGNTYYFLKYLRKGQYLKKLKEFVKRGGVLTGLSAGSIIMTPTIHTAGFPEFDKDENEENVTNLNAMGLVNFEFFPHYKNSKRYDLELLKHSKKTLSPLYACPDGSGILVEKNSLTFHGKCFMFFQGKKIRLESNSRSSL